LFSSPIPPLKNEFKSFSFSKSVISPNGDGSDVFKAEGGGGEDTALAAAFSCTRARSMTPRPRELPEAAVGTFLLVDDEVHGVRVEGAVSILTSFCTVLGWEWRDASACTTWKEYHQYT
jgi:hypothetical protein